jgi:hypothetical protein
MEENPKSISHLDELQPRMSDKQKAQIKAFQEIAGSMAAGILLGDIKESSMNLVVTDSDDQNPISAVIIPGDLRDFQACKHEEN